ncbi:uncharacterized protein N7511_005117 [Penicillium nucicola]|uniref:uncharacterized protein n=1 Tax=Penicillium nucicola TaxID=1850975 RepID=UPI00254599A1|nr:uncharacterized protein N7511_005117 [Penicillium nucicola]KAJ5761735.1 hypothetical protein N7511_005117 [Penicillium nucicola]
MATRAPLSQEQYTVGWICALPLEMAAASLMLDTIHPTLPNKSTDQNTYTLGNIGEHNIVIACLPVGAYGNVSAATVAMQLLWSFPSIRFGLMVGIGGGVPNRNADIRLGDIVVSQPRDTSGGVIQYDLGKVLQSGQFQRTGMLNRPPKILLTALATLQGVHLMQDSRVVEFISKIHVKTTPRKAANFARPAQEDHLYQSDYDHGESATCVNCDRSKLTCRPVRDYEEPEIHYGLIASANQVVKDGKRRDQLAEDLGVYCVEMEAAGLMNDFPCVVIRGICDYADSHKNKEWQGYAAAVAAAYAKELILVVPVNQVDSIPTAREIIVDAADRFKVSLDLAAIPVIESFVGRQAELDQLWQYLKPTDSQARKVAVLHGLGGMGKTQLAVRFAREHKQDFSAIFWLSGKDRGTLLQSLSSVLPRLPGQPLKGEATNDEELEQRAREVLKWLAQDGNSRWLIIFDNIDQYFSIDGGYGGVGNAYDIGKFFPTADHGSILITSRLSTLFELGEPFPIQKLDSKEAIQLLLKNSGLSKSNSVNEIERDPNTLALADCLDGLPLAIIIAAAFMRETGTSITQYLKHYRGSWSNLQALSSPGRQYQQGNMLETWQISFYEIQNRDPNAAHLLLLLARFDNRDIWYELLKSASNCSNIPGWLERAISSELQFKACLKPLIGFSFLQEKPQEGSYTMHPVVQDWCFHITSIDTITNAIQLSEVAFICVGYSVPAKSERDYAELERRLLPHTIGLQTAQLSLGDNAILGGFHNLGDLYSDQGKLKEAEEMYQRALAGYEKAFGHDHTSALDIIHNLGLLYSNQGKLKEAEGMYRRALVGCEKVLGPYHTSTLDTVNNFGFLYSHQGKLKEAGQMYQRALKGYEKALGPDHTSTLNTVNNIGLLYSNQGKLKEAEEMYQRSLVGYEKALGEDHTSTLDIVNNLGSLYVDQGKLKEAAEMYHRSLVGYENALGQDHISTLNTVDNLGNLYSHQGELRRAEEMYQRALVGKEKALGPDHTSTLNTVNNLGLLYSNQGKLKEAEEMYQRSLVGYEKALGQDHTSTLDTVNNLGNLYADQGKLNEAEEMYQRAILGYENALGPDNTFTLDAVHNLGLLHSDQVKLKETEEIHHGELPDIPKVANLNNSRARRAKKKFTGWLKY